MSFAHGLRAPDIISRPLARLKGGLAAGTATSIGGIAYEIIPVRGALRGRVRIKTATNGGTIDVIFVGPDFDASQGANGVAYASLVGTQYTTGNPTQVAVTAATDTTIVFDCYGESYAIVKFTGTVGVGSISYCDVCQLSEAAV